MENQKGIYYTVSSLRNSSVEKGIFSVEEITAIEPDPARPDLGFVLLKKITIQETFLKVSSRDWVRCGPLPKTVKMSETRREHS